MHTVTIGVSSLEQSMHRFEAASRGEKQGEHLSFATIELMWKVLIPRRWEMLQAMTGKPPMSLRSVARLMDRDVKTTHGDVHALLRAGILKKDESGKLVFPYDAIHVDFMINKAA